MSNRVKTIHCLDGKKRVCERNASNDGWIYIYMGQHGTTLATILDTHLKGNHEISDKEVRA